MSKRQQPNKTTKQKSSTAIDSLPLLAPVSFWDKLIRFISNKNYQILLIVVTVFAFYGNSINNDFAADDGIFYTNNKFVQKGVNGIHDLFTKESMYGYYGHASPISGGRWRPLSLITFAIEKEYSGADSHISHLINMVLLAITGIIMLIFLRQYVFKSSPVAAFLVVLLFIIHPVHIEAVSHIKSRDELLSWLFLLLTMYCGLNFLTKRNYRQLVLSLLFYFLSLLSKENGITFIVILPFTFYFFTKEKLRTIALTTLPFVVILGIYALIRFSIVTVMTNAGNDITITSYMYATPVEHIATALMVLGKYILLLLWPNPLISDYSYNSIPYVNFSDWRLWLSVVIQVMLVFYALYKIKEKNLVSYGILFYFCSIFIVSNIVADAGAILAERFLYQPSFGFCIAIVAATSEAMQKIKVKNTIYKFSVVSILITAVVLLSGFQTIQRNYEWNNDRLLWSADVKKAPACFALHQNLGRMFVHDGTIAPTEEERTDDFNKGLREYDTATTIFPNYAITWFNMGYLYLITGNKDGAIKAYSKCIDIDSTFSQGYNGLGAVYYYEKNYEQALFYYKKGNYLKPGDTRFYTNIGLCYDNLGEYEKAISYYKKALSLDPNLDNAKQDISDDENLLQNKKQ